MSEENILIRAYDPSYDSHDQVVIKKIALETWPQNPKIYSNQGFIIEVSRTNENNTIIGFLMYTYVKPEIINKNPPYMSRENASSWWDIDFKKHFNSFLNSFTTNDNDNGDIDVKQREKEINDEYLRCSQLNPNLKDVRNWNRINSHIIHITDFALIESFRGRGFGTYLLQTLIYSFPQSTRFGLEVAANNHIAINCYQKCGFIIERRVPNYYSKNKSALKMTLISSYNNDDLSKFILSVPFNNNTNAQQSKSDKMAKYRVRFMDLFNEKNLRKDCLGIQRILYDTWPNQKEYGFDYMNYAFIIIVEQICEHAINDETETCVVGFACCSWKLLRHCASCADESKKEHRHDGWYLDIDINEKIVKARKIGNRSDYKQLLFEYNTYLNQHVFDWRKLRKYLIHIRQFAIDKHHRHKGLGSLMMKNIVHLFPQNTMFGLEVETGNLNAIRLYKKYGFEIKREINNYYGFNRNAYKMVMINKNISVNESLDWLKKNKIVLRARIQNNTGNYNNININILNTSENKEDGDENECIYIIRKFDEDSDKIYVEGLLNDKKTWKYWPYIESVNGFVVERIYKHKNNHIFGYIGYHLYYTNMIDDSSWINENVIYITQFCIHYKCQNCGIGTQLMSYFIQSFPNKSKFAAEIETTNELAIKLFKKFGFTIQKSVANFYGVNRNAYKMTLTSHTNKLNGLQNKFKCILNDKNEKHYKIIKEALKYLCGHDWKKYFQNFKNQQVFDNDIFDLNDQDLKCLINKIGPRTRVRQWIKQLKLKNKK